jgi:hypothetical protein
VKTLEELYADLKRVRRYSDEYPESAEAGWDIEYIENQIKAAGGEVPEWTWDDDEQT